MEALRERLTVERCLPEDRERALLVGRAWVPAIDGPSVVAVDGDDTCDLSSVTPTMTALLELDDPADAIRATRSLPRLGALADVLANSDPAR